MSRRQNRVSPLAIVLPQPPLPRRRSSLLSTGSASSTPRTPRSSACGSPNCSSWFIKANNRKSSDSWNSSNQDFGDDVETADWKADHILLLSRTLDALPSHLVTPFNGPIPPSNLLDKIARGVAQAKGPNDWPFSLRATRVKLIEIARSRAKRKPRYTRTRTTIISFVVGNPNFLQLDRNPVVPYIGNPVWTFSMGLSLKIRTSTTILRGASLLNLPSSLSVLSFIVSSLSNRLQRTSDCLVSPTTSYHLYSRTRTANHLSQRRSASPPRPSHLPSLLSPSTPSTSTLTTLTTLSSSCSHHRRSAGSTLSSMTSNESLSSVDAKLSYHQLLPSSMASATDPRVQRVRRSESFCGPSASVNDHAAFIQPATPAPVRQSIKRAPSFGAAAQEFKESNRARVANDLGLLGMESPIDATSYPSSDEEEKKRSRHVKKARTKNIVTASPPLSQPSSSTPTPEVKAKGTKKCRERKDPGRGKTDGDRSSSNANLGSGRQPTSQRPAQRMSLQRNPSIFGAELPHLHIPPPADHQMQIDSMHMGPSTVKKTPTLRRVRRLGLAPSRRISFGSLVVPEDSVVSRFDQGHDADVEEDGETGLGSAFQLR
ncbi:hypothetical protein EV421DRAFT_1991212 [Armillaria borealis]|uniref:Uncharacterized protein n=1 Tax=Armillaria borealis TaxID=47425 RepID=A0AA39MY78_9AGAR|nr:hypothetical protein EV421DRAFT_1991212 [Armillaria borealis]